MAVAGGPVNVFSRMQNIKKHESLLASSSENVIQGRYWGVVGSGEFPPNRKEYFCEVTCAKTLDSRGLCCRAHERVCRVESI